MKAEKGHFTEQFDGGDARDCVCHEYGPFGEVIRASGPMAIANPFRFSTKYQDDESDLLYFGHRYYDASTGRWLNRDPIQELGGINLYGFVGKNPVNRVDPLGLSWYDYIPGIGPGIAQIQANHAEQAQIDALNQRRGNDDPNLDGNTTAGNVGGVRGVQDITDGTADLYVQTAMQIGMAGIVTKAAPAAAQGIADAAEGGWLSKLWSKCKAPFKKAPTGLSPGARTEAKNLAEQLVLQEAQAGAGTRIMQGAINDPNFPEDVWAKMQWVHDNPDGTSTVIHY
jgi:RHS repeat-associated protein